jgi:glycosyltransferase involved in cell wall biosynthesis
MEAEIRGLHGTLKAVIQRSDRLTIAHVNSESSFSGGEVQVFLLMEGLRKLGHRNILYCPPGSRSHEECRRRGIEAVTVAMRNNLDLPAIWSLRRSFKNAGIDIVHLHTGRATWLGGWAAYAAGLPAITTRRMDREVKRNWRTKITYRTLVQRAVAISPGVAGCLEAGGVRKDMTRLISSSVDPARLQPSAARDLIREALYVPADAIMLLCVGSFYSRKGFDVLIRAIDLLRGRGLEPIVCIAGSGPEEERLHQLVHELRCEDQVKFLGNREAVADLFHACDVFVMPSRREGLGVACLEAMAARRPVIASRVGGLGEAVVHERTGLLVPPEDAAALADALERIIADPALRTRLGAAGPERVAEGFLPEQMVTAYQDLYREVLADRNGGRAG